MNIIRHCSAIELLNSIQTSSIDLIYTDPPFGTQNKQTSLRKKKGEVISTIDYVDRYDDYVSWLRPHIEEFKRVLKPTGTLYLHLDWRWVHYAKVMLDEVFGKDCFLNEIVWSYNFGGRGKRSWPAKHDTILMYTREKDQHVFNWDKIDRIPYIAPEMQFVGRTKEEAEKRIALGQIPTDVWNMSIVGTNSKERLGCPNQKPLKLLNRIILASSNEGDLILDPFAGSGTTGFAAYLQNRSFILSDLNNHAIKVMKERFKNINVEIK